MFFTVSDKNVSATPNLIFTEAEVRSMDKEDKAFGSRANSLDKFIKCGERENGKLCSAIKLKTVAWLVKMREDNGTDAVLIVKHKLLVYLQEKNYGPNQNFLS